MTPARPQRKARGLIVALAGLGLAGVLSGSPAKAATTEQLILALHTGFALGGFDPVAYFTEGRPLLGRAEFEYDLRGTTWRFRNEGNRSAFAADPTIYIPQFGGYDPVALSRGATTAGYPQIWLIVDKRLYFFYSPEARAAFAAGPETAIAEARAKWPELSRKLAP